jgi:DNA polymerase-1
MSGRVAGGNGAGDGGPGGGERDGGESGSHGSGEQAGACAAAGAGAETGAGECAVACPGGGSPGWTAEGRAIDAIRDCAQIGGMARALAGAASISVFPIFEKRGNFDSELFGAALWSDAGHAFYVAAGGLDQREAARALLPALTAPGQERIGHDVKQLYHWFFKHLGQAADWVFPAFTFDTMLGGYVADAGSGRYSLPELCLAYLDAEPAPIESLTGKGRSRVELADVPEERLAAAAAQNASAIMRLAPALRGIIAENGQEDLYYSVEMPLAEVLASMEVYGFSVDTAGLRLFSAELDKKITALTREIYDLAGEEFNILSPKQLGEVLFEHMKLPAPKRGAKGDWSTDVEVLRSLSYGGVPIADKILKYREIAKLKGTYADALPRQISPKDGRVHTHYFQAGTSTGRLSSNDPNLQNIPIRTDRGQDIRRAFVAAPGYVLLSADYSQIELRILADVADVKNLKKAFEDGMDIHAKTASEIFGVPMGDMTPELRRRAKAINFGIIYGISPFGLAKNIGATQAEARAFIDSYFRAFPEIRAYMEDTKAFAHSRGYVETKFGRRCFVANINNPKLRAYGERAAINAPIQGTNADIIKIAMARIRDELRRKKLDSEIRMLLQVHDELVFEVHGDMVEKASGIIKPIMEGAAKLSIPATVDIGTGANWKDAH